MLLIVFLYQYFAFICVNALSQVRECRIISLFGPDMSSRSANMCPIVTIYPALELSIFICYLSGSDLQTALSYIYLCLLSSLSFSEL